MADGSVRTSVVAAAMSSLMKVPEDTPGPLLAAGSVASVEQEKQYSRPNFRTKQDA
jgi:hypothetical protein